MENIATAIELVRQLPDAPPSHPDGAGAQQSLNGTVSAIVPDWQREQVGFGAWMPGMQVLRAVRGYQRWRHRWGIAGRFIAGLYFIQHRLWSTVAGADIPIAAAGIGGGLVLMHPNGIVIHPDSIIGPNCMIFQQVTIGTRDGREGLPRIGGHVDIGAGAKLLGPIVVGDHAKIGANAVVIFDVPAGSTAVGVPARILPPKHGVNRVGSIGFPGARAENVSEHYE